MTRYAACMKPGGRHHNTRPDLSRHVNQPLTTRTGHARPTGTAMQQIQHKPHGAVWVGPGAARNLSFVRCCMNVAPGRDHSGRASGRSRGSDLTRWINRNANRPGDQLRPEPRKTLLPKRSCAGPRGPCPNGQLPACGEKRDMFAMCLIVARPRIQVVGSDACPVSFRPARTAPAGCASGPVGKVRLPGMSRPAIGPPAPARCGATGQGGRRCPVTPDRAAAFTPTPSIA